MLPLFVRSEATNTQNDESRMQFAIGSEGQEIRRIDRHDGHVLLERIAEQRRIGKTGASDVCDVHCVDAEFRQPWHQPRRQVLIEQEFQSSAARKRRRFLGRPGDGFMPA